MKAGIPIFMCLLLSISYAQLEFKYAPGDNPSFTSFPRIWDTGPLPDKALETWHNFMIDTQSEFVKTLPKWDWPHAYTDVFTTNISTVRILGGWTDHNTSDDLAYSCGDKKYCYRFDEMFNRLDPLVSNGMQFVFVLDNVPWCFTSKNVTGVYGNVYGPDDPKVYSQFIEALVRALVGKYGSEQVQQWIFRVATEPNNAHHWSDTMEKFYETYDWVTYAVRKVLPKARMGLGNFCMSCGSPTYPLAHDIVNHIGKGRNYVTGKIGSPIDVLGMSVYGSKPNKYSINTVVENVKVLRQFRELVAPNRSQEIEMQIMEFGTLTNPFDRRSPEPGCFGSAWVASASLVALRGGISKIYHWGFFDKLTDGEEYLLFSQGWLMAIAELLIGSEATFLSVSGTTSNQHADGVGLIQWNENKSDISKIFVLLTVFDNTDYASTEMTDYKVTLDLAGLKSSFKVGSVSQFKLDRNNSVYDIMYNDLKKINGLQYNDGRLYPIHEMTNTVGHNYIEAHKTDYFKMQTEFLKPKPYTGKVSTISSDEIILSDTIQTQSVSILMINPL